MPSTELDHDVGVGPEPVVRTIDEGVLLPIPGTRPGGDNIRKDDRLWVELMKARPKAGTSTYDQAGSGESTRSDWISIEIPLRR